MKPYKSYKFKFMTLTPLNIGSGDKWYPFEYWKKNEKLVMVNFDKFIEYILSQDAWKQFFNKLIKVFSNRKFYHNKRFDANFDIILKELGMINKKEEFKTVELKYVKELENNEGQIKKEIIKFIREKDKLLIPGSSIKGALRTAFIYYGVSNADIINLYDDKEKKREITKYVNKKFDFYNTKNILIRDTLINKETKIHLVKRLGVGKGARLNGIEVLEVDDKDKIIVEIQARGDIKKIIKEVNGFSLASINAILKISSVNKNQTLVSELERIKSEIHKNKEASTKMIFQLGRGGSYFNKSIGEKIIEVAVRRRLDTEYLDKLRKFLKFGGRKIEGEEFPKTFSVDQNNQPFGWVKLVLKEK